MAVTVRSTQAMSMVWIRLAGFGAVFGLALWLLGLAIAHFVIEPLACGINGSSTQCVQAIDIAGGVATILVTAGSLFAAIWWRIARPLFVVLSAGLLLWGLSGWTDGLFWLEAALWSAWIGALAFLLFGWLNRTQSIALTVLLTIAIIVAERIVLSL